MRRRSSRHGSTEVELNITAFLNLMVILIPFLLITAVFSRIMILELKLPKASNTPVNQEQKDDEPPTQLNIIVRQDKIQIGDQRGVAKTFTKKGPDFDFAAISEFLQNVKDKQPDKKDANILAEPDIAYELLVHVMDTVRQVEIGKGTAASKVELFPEMSLGDAPAEQ